MSSFFFQKPELRIYKIICSYLYEKLLYRECSDEEMTFSLNYKKNVLPFSYYNNIHNFLSTVQCLCYECVCVFTSSFCVCVIRYLLLQCGHAYGRAPVCVRMCSVRQYETRKDLPQISHEWGFSPWQWNILLNSTLTININSLTLISYSLYVNFVTKYATVWIVT